MGKQELAYFSPLLGNQEDTQCDAACTQNLTQKQKTFFLKILKLAVFFLPRKNKSTLPDRQEGNTNELQRCFSAKSRHDTTK